jgi:hypothetical protein
MTYAELKQIDLISDGTAPAVARWKAKLDAREIMGDRLTYPFNPLDDFNHARIVTNRVREIMGRDANKWVNDEMDDAMAPAVAWLTATAAEITLAALLALAKWREEGNDY